MTIREIVKIDEEKCTGCGLCVPACAEGAIKIVDGKARLTADALCDGLGACLGECPEGAITVEKREAEPFDERMVAEQHHGECGCPGAKLVDLRVEPAKAAAPSSEPATSELRQWPIQLRLVPPTAPFFRGANAVLCADCVAYAVGGFHSRFLRGRALAIACPKLDSDQEGYLEKLTAIIDQGGVDTMSVMVMEVPCCSGLVRLAEQACAKASRKVPLKLLRIGIRGEVIEERWL